MRTEVDGNGDHDDGASGDSTGLGSGYISIVDKLAIRY